MKNSKNSIEEKRHTLAHLLASAVLAKYPKAKLGIGPTIENGFYYDFDLGGKLKEEDLEGFEQTMRDLIGQELDMTGEKVTADEARKLFADQPYKLELIDEYEKEGRELTSYTIGDFTDLCKGGHADNTRDIDAGSFALTSIAGAYWRGDENNPQLQRVYALAFDTPAELAEHQTMLEEAKKRDHRKLGKELGLFAITEEVGPGLPLFYPKGATLRRIVENFITELQEKRGYESIWIPHITKSELYKISGHAEKYDALYPPMHLEREADYFIKPMNCPHFMMLYKTTPHSYRELPVRWTCTTTNYRHEKSGELSGLTRVRSLTQDDCHVFTRKDQIEEVIEEMLDMIEETYATFGFKDFWVRISTHDPENKEQYIGDPAIWEESEKTLTSVISKRGWQHEIGVGEAAFYGPKLDFIFKDVIGRSWQLSTIQLDMNLPERFELEYIDSDGEKKRPVVIHRAILGSTERFLGILIEHYGGAFPFWLAPVQVKILTINDKVIDYTNEVTGKLKAQGVRIELDTRNESIGKKIREAEMEKVPYIFVIGEKEVAASQVNVRTRGMKDTKTISLEQFPEDTKN
ncbi:MAG: threonine--tRNA ligase [Patescibacteria group bacterium]